MRPREEEGESFAAEALCELALCSTLGLRLLLMASVTADKT